jgi:hypothetical protein
VLDLLTDGSVTLTAVTLLGPVLTAENHRAVLEDARHKSKRDVEHLVARLRPRPAVPPTVRKLPASFPSSDSGRPCIVEPEADDARGLVLVSAAPAAPRPAVVTPLAPERYKVQFTVTRETHDRLRRAQDLLRHSIPNGDPAAIFDRALTLLLADLDKPRIGPVARPRGAGRGAPGSRYIPAAIRKEVWRRDGGQCAFVGTLGRCSERGFLEFHHLHPYSEGGETTVENLRLRCRAHNLHEAAQYFGDQLPLLVRETARFVYGPGPDRATNIRAEMAERPRSSPARPEPARHCLEAPCDETDLMAPRPNPHGERLNSIAGGAPCSSQ